MNDGTLYYWFMWMGWVITTFLIEKGRTRDMMVLVLLTGIILSGLSVPFQLGSVNTAFLFFLCVGLAYVIVQSNQLLYYVTSCFILATAYVSLELFALYDPVKLIFNKKYMIIFILTAMLIVLSKTKKDQFFIPLIGLFIGDTLHQLIIYRLIGKIGIGSMYVMDILASTTMMLIFMVVLVDMFKKLRRAAFKKVQPAKQI